MADSAQQRSFSGEQTQRPSPLAVLTSDSYTLLLAVALLVLLGSLAVLGHLWFRHYGLGAKPVIGQVTAVSPKSIRLDLGSRQGLQVGHRLLALRRGVFLADLSVKTVDNDTASAVAVMLDAKGKPVPLPEDAPRITLVKGDTVVLSPLAPKP